MVGERADRLGREWAELQRRLGVRVSAPGPGPLGSPEDRATARRIREAALDRWEELQRQGRTAWIEDTSGQLVPVPGATRRPKGYGRS